ncbi:hypothetical protein [Streptomyces sp. SP18BB07]|uniref:hypothetical protein n=1 Tax=Streptomyces sp. SP18BB07 TaxID=3002522 RepID=UPI002E781FE8|nr:hypothetical protein [Streptomyces sp. SP18BB07]MEE1760879.1 hypothetical protein [Streptomyces sp. SP18BB07]
MTETPSESTDLKTQYTAQVAADLERNAKEQERLIGEIDALQEQLLSLRQDHAVLVNMQQALGVAASAAAPVAEEVASPSVPRQKTVSTPGAGKRTRAKKAEPPQDGKRTKKSTATKPTTAKSAAASTTTKTATATAKAPTDAKATTTKGGTAKATTAKSGEGKATTAKTAATKTAAKTAATKSAAAEKAQPTLVELIRRHLTEQSEPRSAAEVATALTQAHPDRRIQTNVVRTTLEGLVAKSNAQRVKQGSSVYYTGPDAPEPAVPPQSSSEPAQAAD